jgi:hypothetical protein
MRHLYLSTGFQRSNFHRSGYQQMGSKLFGSKLWSLLLVLGLVMATGTPSLAQRRYTPPGGGSAPTGNGIGGTRSGGCTGTAAPFTALAPISHIGQTAATHPTIALYVPDSQPLPIDFRIYRYDNDRLQPQPVYQTELTSTPGIMNVTLPQSEPALRVGERYFWQAALICDPSHGSEDLIVGTDMLIVSSGTPETERWYDLFQTAPLSESLGLLQQLATLAQSSSNQVVLRQSEQLQQVIEAERQS